MRKLSWIFILFLFTRTLSVHAQKSEIYTNDSEEYNRALYLYQNQQYQSAQILFDRILSEATNSDIKAESAYYSAISGIRLDQAGADVAVENFVQNYPTSSKQNLAYIEVAHYYFEQGRYPQALEWFDRVNEGSLTQSEMDKF